VKKANALYADGSVTGNGGPVTSNQQYWESFDPDLARMGIGSNWMVPNNRIHRCRHSCSAWGGSIFVDTSCTPAA